MASLSLPLDKRYIVVDTKGKKENVSLLDPRWKEDIQFVSYQVPPVNDRVEMEEWKDRLKFISEDLHLLLQQPHDKFWCQVIHDNTLQNLLDTYLRFSPRSYDVVYRLPEDVKTTHNEVHKLVFMTCLRMATYKESQEHHITPHVFGEILYENFLFDIPKIFDLCVLYGEGNSPLLTKIVDNIFTQQPKYNDDLQCAIPTIIQVFHDIGEKCGLSIDKQGSLSPQKLSSPRKDNSPLIMMIISDFQDIVLYLADIALTLANFLEIHPKSCDLFLQEQFIPRLAEFYDVVFPEILQALKMRNFENISQKKLLKRKLKQATSSFMKIVNIMVNHCFLQPVLDQSSKNSDCIEGFIETFSAVLGDRRFLADFDACCQVQVYLDIITQSACNVDETRIQYIQEAVNSAFATYGKRRKPTGGMNRGGRTSPDGSPEPLVAVGGVPVRTGDQFIHEDYTESYNDYEGACSEPRKIGIELESMVSSVKDLLPDLGEGFIELCLDEMGYNIEKVINAVLEEKLPPSLLEIDRKLPRVVPEETVLTKRHNVFDNDEFDVFRRDDIDKSKIHRGKMSKSDKVDLDVKPSDDMKFHLNERYGYQLEPAKDGEPELYDDEYDDTYDTSNVGAFDADSADELTARRPFTVPRILGGKRTDTNSSPDSDSEESDSDKPIRDEFVQNPALLRQRAEERARWQAQRRGQGRHQGHNRPSNPDGAEKKHDVKGKAKGQGQDVNVLRNRRWKEQHKGGNRRQMADKKRM